MESTKTHFVGDIDAGVRYTPIGSFAIEMPEIGLWNEVLLWHDKGILREIKLESMQIILSGYYRTTKYVVNCKVSGIGQKTFEFERTSNLAYTFWGDLFLSVEDFKAKNHLVRAKLLEQVELGAWFENKGICNFTHAYNNKKQPIYYVWDGVRALMKFCDIPKVINFKPTRGFYTEEPYHTIPVCEKTYATKEECELDNEIKVSRFSDDETPKEPFIFKATFDVFLNVLGEDAYNEVADAYNDMLDAFEELKRKYGH